MFIGHFALGLAAKRAAPNVSLAVLFIAAQLADALWPIFRAAGLEQVRIEPGNTAFTPLDFVKLPLLALADLPAHLGLRDGPGAFIALMATLLLIYVGNIFGPPPPSVRVLVITMAAGIPLFTVWSWWADRHRDAVAVG